MARKTKTGRRLVDKLVKVWRRDGEETWVLVHVEVQGQEEGEFARRMYIYNYRLFDQHARQVVSLAVLADERAGWRPRSFGYELWGCRVSLEFPMVKLLDYRKSWAELERSKNPFSVVVMAHLKTKETRQDPEGRFQWKLTLSRMLHGRGYGKRDIEGLLSFIDWLMVLPEGMEQKLTEALSRYEEEKGMKYVTSFERVGIKKGMQQGIQQGILRKAREDVIEILEARFEEVPESVAGIIKGLEDLSMLKMLLKKSATVGSLEEFEQVLRESII